MDSCLRVDGTNGLILHDIGLKEIFPVRFELTFTARRPPPYPLGYGNLKGVKRPYKIIIQNL